MVELPPELGQVVVGDDLFPRFEQRRQLVLEIHDLARARGGQLERAVVHADDVVHGVVRVEREPRAAVDRQLLAAPNAAPGDQVAHLRIGRVPARPPDPQRVCRQLAQQALAVGVAAADERDRARERRRLFSGRLDGVVQRRHAIPGQVVEVLQAHLLELPERVPRLREEQVVGLDALERDHQERVVGEVVQEQGVDPRLHPPDHSRRDGAALED